MKTLGVSEKKVKAISAAVTEYVDSLGTNDWIEGIFVMPCGIDSVESIVLGIVYNNWQMRNVIERSDKNRLHMTSIYEGISLQIKDVSFDKCLDFCAYRNYDQPIKGMVKSSCIIYDAHGRLHTLQAEYQKDSTIESLESRGAVEMVPVIQYTKSKHNF